MLDLNEIYNFMTETKTISQEAEELLDRIMSISSPMKFDANFATDEQLDSLTQALEGIISLLPKTENLIFSVLELESIVSNEANFI
jgi:acyl carrier protein phosphodiesterase